MNGNSNAQGHKKTRSANRTATRTLMIVLALALSLQQFLMVTSRTQAAGPEVSELNLLASEGSGQQALELLANEARSRGNWEPAPGDELVFAPYMARNVRGRVQDFDELPFDCDDPKVSADPQACREEFFAIEKQVRFGRSLFTTPTNNGPVERPAFDDVLATFIEEVGHSWQEYQYETNGAGSGNRVRKTTIAEAEYWAAGREYQIKRYILALDGTLLSLSDEQRDTLTGQICEGYANPSGHEVPGYGAPAGWPQPENWPTAQPTAEELSAFCGASA